MQRTQQRFTTVQIDGRRGSVPTGSAIGSHGTFGQIARTGAQRVNVLSGTVIRSGWSQQNNQPTGLSRAALALLAG